MTYIEQGQTNPKALQDLIELKYKEVFKSTEEEATEWSRNFVASLPERKSKLQEIEDTSKNLSKRFQEKWQPILDFTYYLLMHELTELSRSTKTHMESQDTIPIIADSYPKNLNKYGR